MDCGLSRLRMIAKYYEKSYSLQSLRSKSFITKSGVSMLSISDATESIGFRARGYRLLGTAPERDPDRLQVVIRNTLFHRHKVQQVLQVNGN